MCLRHSKIFQGSMPPEPPSYTPGSCLVASTPKSKILSMALVCVCVCMCVCVFVCVCVCVCVSVHMPLECTLHMVITVI